MPNEVVWVDKILNPRSVVLTYNEAMNVLKKAKTASGRSQFIVAECKPSTSTTTIKIEDQKDECLKFLTFDKYETETKSIIQMQEELQTITASKIAFNEAVNKNSIHADGLPRLKPSLLLKKDMMRSQKDKKKNSVGSKLANINATSINKEAVKNLYADNDNDDIVVLSSSESEKEEIKEPAVKRKRIVISDDDDEDIEESAGLPTSSTTHTVKSVDETISQNSITLDIFKQAFNACIEATTEDPITITFEANNCGNVSVIATSSIVHEIINDTEIPTNGMFTDKAVSSVLNLPITSHNNNDEALKSFWLGETKDDEELSSIKKQIMKKPNMDMIQKLPYNELVKDKKFCSKLLEIVETDIDVTPFFDMDIRSNLEETEYLPKQSILNSLFSIEDLEMMEYKKEIEKIDSNRVREKQRIQHPFVKLKPSLNLNQKTVQINIQRSSIAPKPVEIDYGIKGILKKCNPTDTTMAQTSMKNQLISHNTVIHEALKYLSKNKTTQKTSDEIESAYEKLQKYPLTFLEKLNIITTMPKNLSGILCLLDDLGLRFGKEISEKLEKDCISLFGSSDKNEADDEKEENEKVEYDPEAAKKVRFSKTVEHRFL